MDSTYSSQQLIDAGRQLEVPFNVEITLNGRSEIAECSQLLRLVPERRVVVKMNVGDGVYLGKIFLGKGANKYLEREKSGVLALQEANISTAQLVGVGCLSDGGAELLLIEYLENVQQLDECLADGSVVGLAWLKTTVELVARLHNSDLRHDDFHLGNFLVNEQGLYLIDGDAVEQGELSVDAALENLAYLLVQFPLRFHSELEDFFALYCQVRGSKFDVSQQQFNNHIITRRLKRQERYLLKKVFRDCTQFKVEKNWSRFVALDRQADSLELQTLIQDPDRYIDEGQLLKKGNSATVARVTLNGKTFVVKRYNIKSIGHWLTRFWRPSRAWISWRNAHFLGFYDILTPRPLVMIENRWGICRSKAYFITENVSGGDVLSMVKKSGYSPQNMDELGQQFEQLFMQMKALWFSHGDFKGSNFLLDEGRVTIIDLDSMQIHNSEKAQQAAFVKDQQRFMKNWPVDTPAYKRFLKAFCTERSPYSS